MKTQGKLSPEDQARMLRLLEEIKGRQVEMSLIVSRYLRADFETEKRKEGHGIPVQDAEGNNIGCYDAEKGQAYPIPSDGIC